MAMQKITVQQMTGPGKEGGFALIISMLVLLLLTVIVLGSVRVNTMSEKIAGNYMERNRAFQAAEQAIRQANAILMANPDLCFESVLGCAIAANGQVTALSGGTTLPRLNPLPSTWDSTRAVTISLATGQVSSAQYTVTRTAETSMPVEGGGTVSDCKSYSVMGRGVGQDTKAVVLLQTVVWLCDV